MLLHSSHYGLCHFPPPSCHSQSSLLTATHWVYFCMNAAYLVVLALTDCLLWTMSFTSWFAQTSVPPRSLAQNIRQKRGTEEMFVSIKKWRMTHWLWGQTRALGHSRGKSSSSLPSRWAQAFTLFILLVYRFLLISPLVTANLTILIKSQLRFSSCAVEQMPTSLSL